MQEQAEDGEIMVRIGNAALNMLIAMTMLLAMLFLAVAVTICCMPHGQTL